MSLLFLAAAMLAGAEPAAAQPAPGAEKPKKICKGNPVTGTRLARSRICMTKEQWAAESEEINKAVVSGMGRSNKLPTN